VPEPWATRLVNEGGGKILVKEADLWPGGRYVTTQLIVTTDFLKAHPATIQALVNGQVAANDFIKTNTADAETDVSNGIKKITGKAIDGNLVIASFKNIEFTNDPIASSLVKDNTTQKRFGFTSDNMKVKAKLSSTFTEHGIQVPQLLFLKVANEIQMAIDLVFVRQ